MYLKVPGRVLLKTNKSLHSVKSLKYILKRTCTRTAADATDADYFCLYYFLESAQQTCSTHAQQIGGDSGSFTTNGRHMDVCTEPLRTHSNDTYPSGPSCTCGHRNYSTCVNHQSTLCVCLSSDKCIDCISSAKMYKGVF